MTNLTESFHDYVDRAILHVQTASVGKHPDLRTVVHFVVLLDRQRPGIVGPRRQSTPVIVIPADRAEWPHMIHISAEGRVVRELECELNRSDQSWCWNISESILWHTAYVSHNRDSAARPNINRRASTSDPSEGIAHRMCEIHRILGDASPQRTTCSGHEKHRAKRGLAVFAYPFDRFTQSRR